jgi:hypothetical protein
MSVTNLRAQIVAIEEQCQMLNPKRRQDSSSVERPHQLPIQPTFTRTAHGASGFTFICSACIEQEPTPQQIPTITKVILKWQNHANSQNEKSVTDAMEKFGFNVPVITEIDRSLSKSLISFARKSRSCVPVGDEDSYTLLAMNYLQGSNFEDCMKKGDFFQLQLEDYQKIFFSFGKASVFDVFLGNHDRIVKFNFNNESLDDHPTMNSGNVMLDIIQNVSERTFKIQNVYYIDSTSKLLESENKTEPEEEDYSIAMIWSPSDHVSSAPVATIEPQREVFVSKILKNKHTFKVVLKLCFNETARFVDHIYNSIFNEVSHVTSSDGSSARDMGKEFLSKKIVLLRDALHSGVESGKIELCSMLTQTESFDRRLLESLEGNLEVVNQKNQGDI